MNNGSKSPICFRLHAIDEEAEGVAISPFTVNGSTFDMNPAQRVIPDVELAGVVGHDHRAAHQAVMTDRTPSVPICVIAKERLSGAAGDGVEEALKIGSKRAVLRRSLYQVLERAHG
ncbi:hypothetical protein [Rhizobium sp. BK602]|uniref:hypothetical protein n=1 Tax=Rhizobium sp. BK602 TaxID=2586986 RepID=UPI001620DA43|nr:hypothetical protein [Rhizobium sp. BK602]MBB3610241.1 hypothetical protein [Rhizobium sp. BK602]